MRHIAALAMLLSAGSTVEAQEMWLAATVAQSNHRILGNPGGIAGGATFPLQPRFAFRVAYSLLDSDQTRVGSTCTGLVLDPAECAQEPIDDAATLQGVMFGLVGTVARRGRVALRMIPSASVVRVRAISRGLRTGRELTASSAMIGFGVGAELWMTPNTQWPLALHVGGHVGMVSGRDQAIVDGYSPFTDDIRLTRVDVGFSVWRRLR
jgi:hypothetical protein